MRCILCEKFSFSHICKKCRIEFLSPNLFKRKLPSGLKVYSFYRYEDISNLIKTKDSYLGYYIFNILAEISIKEFVKELRFKEKVQTIPIDDIVKSVGYSHTAILTKHSKIKNISPAYNSIIALNRVKYIGKSLNFRENNSRNFKINKNLKKIDSILIDDVITTGSTLQEAHKKLSEFEVETIFALTLATTNSK